MIYAFTYQDVNEAYHELQTLKHHYVELEETRNGKAWVFQEPVVITYLTPSRRVLFDPIRDANPFFHYMEALWMLSGSDTVSFPGQFAKNLKNYSDNGVTLNGAYGYRWRSHFGLDQIEHVVELLQRDPNSRRAVIAMWDPRQDWEESLDLPCNTHVYFRVVKGALTMTVCNRSNDLVWGTLGANVVHMSLLQEFIAGWLKMPVGPYHQFTNNLHIYDGWERKFGPPVRWYTKYKFYSSIPWSPETIHPQELQTFVIDGLDTDVEYTCPVIAKNAVPMLKSWLAYKEDKPFMADTHAHNIYDADWRYA